MSLAVNVWIKSSPHFISIQTMHKNNHYMCIGNLHAYNMAWCWGLNMKWNNNNNETRIGQTQWQSSYEYLIFIKYNSNVSSRPLKSFNTWNRSPFWNALSREFRCRWRHLSCKLRPEIDNRFTFTLIKTTMIFKQIRKKYLWVLVPKWCNFTTNILT
jgi:hypothetical protein